MNKSIKDIIAEELDAPRDEDLYNKLEELDRTTLPIPLHCESPGQRSAIGDFCLEVARGWNELSGKDVSNLFHGLLYGFQLGHDYIKRYGPIW